MHVGVRRVPISCRRQATRKSLNVVRLLRACRRAAAATKQFVAVRRQTRRPSRLSLASKSMIANRLALTGTPDACG